VALQALARESIVAAQESGMASCPLKPAREDDRRSSVPNAGFTGFLSKATYNGGALPIRSSPSTESETVCRQGRGRVTRRFPSCASWPVPVFRARFLHLLRQCERRHSPSMPRSISANTDFQPASLGSPARGLLRIQFDWSAGLPPAVCYSRQSLRRAPGGGGSGTFTPPRPGPEKLTPCWHRAAHPAALPVIRNVSLLPG